MTILPLHHASCGVCLQPVMDEAAMLQLGPSKYKVTFLSAPQQQQNILEQQQYQQQLQAADPASIPQLQEQHIIEQAVAAAAAFRAVAAQAAGMSNSSSVVSPAARSEHSTSSSPQTPAYGPWQPFMAPLVVNQRVTSSDHFQETRHLDFDLEGSGFKYQPGDLLCVFPRTPAADVEVGNECYVIDLVSNRQCAFRCYLQMQS